MSLDVEYFSFSEDRANHRWRDMPYLVSRFPNAQAIEQYISKGGQSIFSRDVLDLVGNVYRYEEDREMNLQELDLMFGSVRSSAIESPSEFFTIEEAFLGRKNRKEYISKQELIGIFENISYEKKAVIEDYLVTQTHCNLLESQELVHQYLQVMHGIAKDLKNTPGAMLALSVNGDYSPEDAEELLQRRMKEHKKYFSGVRKRA